MSERNVVYWTATVNGYSNFGLVDETWWLFRAFVESELKANCKTFLCVLNL